MSQYSIQYEQTEIEILEQNISLFLENKGISWADPEEKMESFYQKKKQELFSCKNVIFDENQDLLKISQKQKNSLKSEQTQNDSEIFKYKQEIFQTIKFVKSEKIIPTLNKNNFRLQNQMGDSIQDKITTIENEYENENENENFENIELSDFSDSDLNDNFNLLSLNESYLRKTCSQQPSLMSQSCGINTLNQQINNKQNNINSISQNIPNITKQKQIDNNNINLSSSSNNNSNLGVIFNSPLMQRRMSMCQVKSQQMSSLSFSSLCGKKLSKFEKQIGVNIENSSNINIKKNRKNRKIQNLNVKQDHLKQQEVI